MKNLLLVIILILTFSSYSFPQSVKVSKYKLKLNLSVLYPTGDEEFSTYNTFSPGGQAEFEYSVSKKVGIFSGVNMDVIFPTLFTYYGIWGKSDVYPSLQISGILGSRFYPSMKNNFFLEGGLGLFDLKPGKYLIYGETFGLEESVKYNSILQTGFLTGTGWETNIGKNSFLSFNARFYILLKRTNVARQFTSTSLTSNHSYTYDYVADVPSRKYLQLTIGYGLRF